MKKMALLSITCILYAAGVISQNLEFVVANPQPNLIEVYGGSFASGDIDGDGDHDLMMSGLNPGRDTALYLNDGSGGFTEVAGTPFPNASATVTYFIDLDGDDDLDLYFSGIGFSIGEFTHIYLNDGTGVFTQLANSSLPEFQGSGATIGDVDGDGDPDIIIAAQDKNGVYVADVFLNDGDANFAPMGTNTFTKVKLASLAFIDIENDGDADVVISGEQQNGSPSTQLYINDGTGNFSPDGNTVFEAHFANDVDVTDTDNDGDLDLLMSGMNGTNEPKTLLYLNDGTGAFSLLANNNLQQTFAGANTFADLDNDGDRDILITGSQQGGLPNIFNKVYENTGNNQFVEAATLGGEYLSSCVVEDFNGDGLKDIIIMGFVDDTNVYWNTTEILETPGILFKSNEVVLYPNPMNDWFTVQSMERINQITVYDLLGKTIYVKKVEQFESTLDVTNVASGTYFITIQLSDSFVTKKVIKL
ncbi:MAG: T9SS type A sorting domain-containing protein [Flavobacteriaceae bacterium]